MVMIALLAASAIASTQAEPEPRATALAQAKATVRILPGARIVAGEIPQTAIARDFELRDSNGARTRVRLIEFP
jgi:hypothetical protein